MRCDIDVDESASCMCNHHKDIEETEGRRDDHEEVTRHDALSMIAEEGRPPLRLTTLARSSHAVVWHVFPHGSGRDAQTELAQELVGDPLLTPRWVILSHLFAEESHLSRDARAAGFGLPPPKEAEALTVPARQRLRLHDAQGRSPVKPVREPNHHEPRRVRGPSGCHVTFFIQS